MPQNGSDLIIKYSAPFFARLFVYLFPSIYNYYVPVSTLGVLFFSNMSILVLTSDNSFDLILQLYVYEYFEHVIDDNDNRFEATVQTTRVRQYQQAEQPPTPESLSLTTPNRHTSVQAVVAPNLCVWLCVCVRVSVYYRQLLSLCLPPPVV